MEQITVAKFALAMRADSLVEALDAVDIVADSIQPRWTNKRLPPPCVEVRVKASDVAAARVIVERDYPRNAVR